MNASMNSRRSGSYVHTVSEQQLPEIVFQMQPRCGCAQPWSGIEHTDPQEATCCLKKKKKNCTIVRTLHPACSNNSLRTNAPQPTGLQAYCACSPRRPPSCAGVPASGGSNVRRACAATSARASKIDQNGLCAPIGLASSTGVRDSASRSSPTSAWGGGSGDVYIPASRPKTHETTYQYSSATIPRNAAQCNYRTSRQQMHEGALAWENGLASSPSKPQLRKTRMEVGSTLPVIAIIGTVTPAARSAVQTCPRPRTSSRRRPHAHERKLLCSPARRPSASSRCRAG